METLKRWFREEYPDGLHILWLIRYELEALWVRLSARFSPRHRQQVRALRQARSLKINIASGPLKSPGWTNVDASPNADVRLDLRQKLPLTSGSAAMIFSEHFLDHLEYPHTARRFLAECLRILEPGGRVRFVLHDAERMCRAYVDRDVDYFRRSQEMQDTLVGTINLMFRFNGFHKFIYDFETLEKLLLEVGFSRVLRCEWKKSEVPGLAQDFDQEAREVLSMYVEAVK